MKKILCLIILSLILAGCEPEVETPPEPVVRAVKTLLVSKTNQANSRRISGVVRTSNQSELSFRVGGRISSVEIEIGDTVTEGQVLATLDQDSYLLALEEAKAKLASAQAELAEKQDALTRQTNLKKKNYVSQAAVDKARVEFEAAKSSVNVEQTRLETAENDLDYTTMVAPFTGKISQRSVDPFVEVSAGKTAFQLQSEESYKVEILMPETLIRDVHHGNRVRVDFPTLKNVSAKGRISEIGAQAEAGNAFLVKVKLDDPPLDIRTGMTAQVTFTFGKTRRKPVFLIPVSALDVRIPPKSDTPPNQQATVYIFNQTKQVIEKRHIRILNLRGNKLEVVSGLIEGEHVIVAGVPFLTEGQKVKLWKPTYNLPAKINLTN